MNRYCSLPILWICISLSKAGQLFPTYNLIAPQPQHIIFPQTQTYSSPSAGIVHPQYFSSFRSQGRMLSHPTALATSIEESAVPNSLKKSERFYSNPYVGSALARESLEFNKEMVVYDRPSEKIDRNEIAKLINNLNRVHYES